jgi:hypothetical protein
MAREIIGTTIIKLDNGYLIKDRIREDAPEGSPTHVRHKFTTARSAYQSEESARAHVASVMATMQPDTEPYLDD